MPQIVSLPQVLQDTGTDLDGWILTPRQSFHECPYAGWMMVLLTHMCPRTDEGNHLA